MSADDIRQEQKFWLRCLAIAASRKKTFRFARFLFKDEKGHYPGPQLAPQVKPHMHDQYVAAVYPGFVRKKKEN